MSCYVTEKYTKHINAQRISIRRTRTIYIAIV